jgi:hypothetical protein
LNFQHIFLIPLDIGRFLQVPNKSFYNYNSDLLFSNNSFE